MAHIQSKYAKLWKPQDLSVDKINSQKMFIDNIDELESLAISVLQRSCTPVTSLEELRSIDTTDILMYVTGTTVMVKSNGLYFFDRSNTTTDDGSTIIAPVNGSGRWISDKTFFGSLAFKNSLSASDVGLGNVPNVATNNQTPTYTKASTLTELVSGEKLSTAFGKISKAVADLISHLASKSNPHSVTATQVGLGNVDNTSDANKPVSTAQATAIADAKKAGTDAQTNLTNHTTTTSNPHSVTKSQVGLGNVPNVATNDQTPTYTAATTLSTLTSGEKLSVSFGKIMKAITDLISHLSSTSNPHNVTKSQVGLGNVDNTSDADKPVSNATQTAINAVATTSNSHIASKSNPHGVTAAQVGLGNVNNTSDANKPVSTAQATAIADAKKAGTDAQASLATHTASTSNPHGVTKSQVGLGNVPNVATNDQTPTYTQAGTLANLSSGEKLSVSFGKIMKAIADLISHLANKSNPHGVTATQIGLGNVDNTSDANKPISTATQTALDGKADVVNGEIPTVSYARLTGFKLVQSGSLNDIKYTGQYGIMSACTNKPSNEYTYGVLEVIMYSSHWLIQRYYGITTNGDMHGIFYRTYYGDSTWSAWKRHDIGAASATAANTLAEAEVM